MSQGNRDIPKGWGKHFKTLPFREQMAWRFDPSAWDGHKAFPDYINAGLNLTHEINEWEFYNNGNKDMVYCWDKNKQTFDVIQPFMPE